MPPYQSTPVRRVYSRAVPYCPFPYDDALIEAAEQVVRSHNSQHMLDQFRNGVVVPGDGALKDVYRFQQLYIIAHGSSGAGGIYDDDGDELSVDDLTQQLLDQRLTTAIAKVKLFVCQGGAAGSSSTARQLKAAMVSRGFNSVTVNGYMLFLSQGALTDDGHKLAASTPSMNAKIITGAKSVRQGW
jgi:hypothetical protein